MTFIILSERRREGETDRQGREEEWRTEVKDKLSNVTHTESQTFQDYTMKLTATQLPSLIH